MVNGSYFQFDYVNNMKYTYSHNHHREMDNWIHAAPFTACRIIEKIDLILGTHTTEYNEQAF